MARRVEPRQTPPAAAATMGAMTQARSTIVRAGQHGLYHLHVVRAVEPDIATNWTIDEVIDRWLQLYPARDPDLLAEKRAGLLGNPEAIARCRSRLTDLSWFMRGLDDLVSRKANAPTGMPGITDRHGAESVTGMGWNKHHRAI